jgi:hypothetical protein
MKAIGATLYLACAAPVLSFTGGLCRLGNAQLASHHWVLRGHLAPAAKVDWVKPLERSPISKAISQAMLRIATVLRYDRAHLVPELHAKAR